jgi:hypothetical protein
MTKPQLQKKALSIGLPKSLSKLSILFGYSPSHLSNHVKKDEHIPLQMELQINLMEKTYNLEKENNFLRMQLKEEKQGEYLYRIDALNKKENFTYSIYSDVPLEEKSISSKDKNELTEKLIDDALKAVVVAFRFNWNSVSMQITRIDTQEEEEQLTKDLLFL